MCGRLSFGQTKLKILIKASFSSGFFILLFLQYGLLFWLYSEVVLQTLRSNLSSAQSAEPEHTLTGVTCMLGVNVCGEEKVERLNRGVRNGTALCDINNT